MPPDLQTDILETGGDWCLHSDVDTVTRKESRDVDSAILPVLSIDISDPVSDHPKVHVSDNVFLFMTPWADGIPPLPVYYDCSTGICSCVHLIGGIPTQLKPCRAAQFLFGDDRLQTMNDSEVNFIWSGFVNGFAIVDDDCPASYFCQNYDSILESKAYEEMSHLLRQELSEHKVSRVESTPTCVHSLGAVWKSNGKLRPITDCSRPDGASINNYMSTTFKSFQYNSVQDAVDMLSPGDHMAVIDISSAYRSVTVTPAHTKFQGLTWDFGDGPVILQDNRLCFGLRSAPNIFDCISSFIVKIANARGASRCVNYLDDFLVIGDTPEQCMLSRDVVTSVITLLGFQVAWKKVTNPSTLTTFLGINIDSIAFELSLPMEKVEKLQSLVGSILNCGYSCKKELECLGGLVSYCSYVVRGGRTFSRRIFDLSASYSRHSKRIPLDDPIKEDLHWWQSFCGIFNGRACIIRDIHPLPVYSDASFEGFGAWLGKDWFMGTWDASAQCPLDPGCGHLEPPPRASISKNINLYELWPIVVAMRRWGQRFSNAKLHFVTDNMQVLAMIMTGRSCNKTCMTWLREIFWMCFIWNVDVCASYIKSADNVLADAISSLPYSGVSSKCQDLLLQLNMCCSSPHSAIAGSPSPTPRGFPEGRPSPCDQEVAPFPD